jgi:4-aminobutyrate aminotransferase-like enzyme
MTTTLAASTSAVTHGQEMRASPAVQSAINAIIADVKARSARITEPRGPHADLRESYDELLKRAGDVRGRGLLYPYIGSGIGNGALVELLDGSIKWDMICGIGVHFFGHSEPDLMREALLSALDDTVKHGNLQTNADAFDFAQTLVAEAGRHSNLRHCYLSTSGAMANEHALKVCYQKRMPSSRVLAFKDCFAGRSIVMSQLGDAAANRQGIPITLGVDYMPFWDDAAAARMGKAAFIDMAVSHLRQYIDRYPGQHACFVMELVQGEGGFVPGDRDYFKALMDVCKEAGVAIWIDEIQTFGRLPSMFAFEHFDLGDYVDVCTIGKMTQACATLFTADFNPKPGLLSGTFTGEGVSFGVGRRIIERLRDGDHYGPNGRNAKHHALFVQQARALIARRPAWFPQVDGLKDLVGGLGGMMRITPFGGKKEPINKACRTCFDEGLVLFYCGHSPYHLRMLPPLGIMREQDWPSVFACLERGLAKAVE